MFKYCICIILLSLQLMSEVLISCKNSMTMYYDLNTMKMDPIKNTPFPITIQKLDNKFFVEANAGSTEIIALAGNSETIQFGEYVASGHVVIYTYHANKKILVMQKSYTDPTSKVLSNAITTIWTNCLAY